ncbi:MAG: endolytic transglycosylase MltG [Woeseiaceae bacterium]|nr:endolytic transglycosylase MltG [Woeseiaceae bacterium]
MKRLLPVMAGLVAAGVLFLAMGLWQAHRLLDQPLQVPAGGVTCEVRPGTALSTVSSRLAERGIVQRPWLLNWYGRITGKAGAIHAGEYLVEAGDTPRTLLDKFVVGSVRLYSFTIVEGWTFREMLQGLGEHPAIERTLAYEDWPALLERLEAEYPHPEGLFLPETYRFPRGTSDEEVLRQAYGLLQKALLEEWQARAVNLPLDSPYEALTLASIVEKETARADERARIAGVFVRRLRRGMRLQTDPAVIYGIGESFDGNLTRRDLQRDTDYNTYTRRGLPPTPIALPGRAAIRAALNPEPGDELYFVATGLGDGSHKFSATREQHEAAVREYLARRRESAGN